MRFKQKKWKHYFLYFLFVIFFFLTKQDELKNTPVPFCCQRELREGSSSCPSSLRILFGLLRLTKNKKNNCNRRTKRKRSKTDAHACCCLPACLLLRPLLLLLPLPRPLLVLSVYSPFCLPVVFVLVLVLALLAVCQCECRRSRVWVSEWVCFQFFSLPGVFVSLHGNQQSLNPISSTLALVVHGSLAPGSCRSSWISCPRIPTLPSCSH